MANLVDPTRRYRRKPTQRQLTALNLIAQGHSARQAMLKAGFSPKTANQPGRKLLRARAVTNLLDKVRWQLEDAGLNTGYMVEKHKALLNDADSKIQLEALRDLRKIWGIDQLLQATTPTPTRRITLEEFIGSEGNVGSEVEVDKVDTAI